MRVQSVLPVLIASSASGFLTASRGSAVFPNTTHLSNETTTHSAFHSSVVKSSSVWASPIPSNTTSILSWSSGVVSKGKPDHSTSRNSTSIPAQTTSNLNNTLISNPVWSNTTLSDDRRLNSSSSNSTVLSLSSNTSVPTSTRGRLLKVNGAARIEAAAAATTTTKAKKVFAHYMLGTITQAHAQQDIDEAIAMGIDGFAFNIGDPSQFWIPESVSNLIGYAEYRGFKFYFSLDVYASGNSCYEGSTGACGGPSAYHNLLADHLGSSAYYLGPNGKPLISTFSSGGEHNDTWADWRESFAQQMYFIPDFDETSGYYTGADGWYEYWGDLCDGLFSWEAAWPYRSGFGGQYPGDISPDLPVLAAATKHKKGYMMSLSALQYKNSYGTSVYRAGDLNLPTRMENILRMAESPDFIQLITWNDGPEGHYIGNLWYEQNNDSLPYRYANAVEWPHSGWQPLILSFIEAWKADKPASEMMPPSGTPAVGALWYKTILQSSSCPVNQNALVSNYSLPPDGFDTGTDQLNYAVVLESGATGYSLQAYSNGAALASVNLKPGLNYGAFTGVQAGYQRMELLHGGAILLAAAGGRCISSGCPDCIYNMNPQVVPLIEDTNAQGTCPYAVCEKQVFAHYMVGNVNEDHAHKDIDDAVAMGLDGFALNVGDPTQNFVRQTFNYMFDYARDNHPHFKLFISMDLWAEGNAFNKVEIDQYYDIFRDFKGHPAYLQGPDGNGFVSSFSSGGLEDTDWEAWRASLNNEVYLVPDIDDTAGYNTSDPGWWGYWGPLIQGVFSWETAWPKVGESAETNDYDVDQVVVGGTFQHVKAYMMPLSPLQYKDSYDTNYIRGGNLNLPQRIEAILNLNPSPDFVEYITWNDGPESHYIGNLWIEQNNDTQPLLYANSDSSHAGWQPLISSFITAFKKSLGPKSMLPPNGAVVAGAMWYNSILTTSTCPSEASGGYFVKPDGFETARDWLNYAIVLSPGTEGATLRAYSNGQLLRGTASLSPGGLIYGAFEGVSAGFQRMEVVGSDGTILAVAAGGRCVSDGCPDCIYNLNPIVVGFGTDTGAVGTCPKSRDCVKVAGDNPGGSGIVYINPSIWTESDPEVFCKPPCILVFPPLLLTATTTITLPPYTTSLVQSRLTTRITTLASGSTSEILGYSLVSESTVITFPHITTTAINVWEQSITVNQTTPYTIYMTSSIDVPTTVITFYPHQTSGGPTTTQGPITSTITPPPYPWTTTTHDPKLNTHTTTWALGLPKPTCITGCGSPCRLFCHGPCLFCPPDIGGILGGAGGLGGSDGDDDSSSECETSTFSICSTACVGSSCTTTCDPTVGCSATASHTSGSIQPATGVSGQYEDWPATQTDDTASDLSVESSLATAIQSVINSNYPGQGSSPTSSSAINTATFPASKDPDIIFCYQSLNDCTSNPCRLEAAYYYWFADDEVSTCDHLVNAGFGENVADPANSDDAAIENSEYHFPVMERVPLGTTYSAQNCYFFPDFHDGTSAGSDNFYRSLAANSDVGEWWCSSGLHYDDSIAVQMGNCYKRTTDSGLVPSDSNSETWTLYYCRAELESWQ